MKRSKVNFFLNIIEDEKPNSTDKKSSDKQIIQTNTNRKK